MKSSFDLLFLSEESLKGEVDDTDGECNNSRSNGGTPPTCDEHLTKAFVCVSRVCNSYFTETNF